MFVVVCLDIVYHAPTAQYGQFNVCLPLQHITVKLEFIYTSGLEQSCILQPFSGHVYREVVPVLSLHMAAYMMQGPHYIIILKQCCFCLFILQLLPCSLIKGFLSS